MSTLVIREGDGAGAEFPLDGETVIGREQASAEVVLTDPGISRRHAAVRDHDGRITVEDLGSSNGTFVNGQRISGEVELADGDEIQLGGVLLSIHGADAATAILGAGAPATKQHPGPAQARPPRQQPRATPGRLGPSPNEEGGNMPALISVFLGPLSLFLILFSSGGAFFVSLPCAIAAIVLGSMGMRRVDRGESDSHRALAQIGRITGIIGTVLSVLALIAFLLVAALLDATEDNLSDLIERISEEIENAPEVNLPDTPDPGGGDSGGVEAP